MAQHKSKEEYIKLALKCIEEKKPLTITELTKFMKMPVSTFYYLELEKLEEIKKGVENSRNYTKSCMLRRWSDKSAAPVLQMGAFKLMGDKDELDRLTGQKIEHSGGLNMVINPSLDD